MTAPEAVVPEDPAISAVNAFVAALKLAFSPDDKVQPPLGGGTKNVRFFAGDGPALAAFDAHVGVSGDNCAEPFAWVRLARRYYFRPGAFPAPVVDTSEKCADTMAAAAIEIGVARCTVTAQATPTFEQYAHEAEVSLDDSWRISLALCTAAKMLRTPKRNVGLDTITPYGPEGGVIAWVGQAFVQL
ncbi:hypothetical protein SEA_BOYLE_25 [Mycobacterium phage Boyle]|uniref:Uncharacterized protein n=2 Tax=Rosebushvirus TaxID=1982900 RepID=G8I7F3_9CAUD|nr:hypothetical protein ARES_25 [Mycobacterium phage Ares]AVR76520.1 hypothetical protein SEA_BOYLE_25 [Mycobacterium phage Boyle]